MMQQQSLTDKASAAQNILHRWLTHTCTHARMRTHTHACMSTCTHTCTQHTHTHTHICMHILTHTHMGEEGGGRFNHHYHYHYHNHWFLNVTLLFSEHPGQGSFTHDTVRHLPVLCLFIYKYEYMPLKTLAAVSYTHLTLPTRSTV